MKNLEYALRLVKQGFFSETDIIVAANLVKSDTWKIHRVENGKLVNRTKEFIKQFQWSMEHEDVQYKTGLITCKEHVISHVLLNKFINYSILNCFNFY